ncbi:MAG: pesticidal protein Cry7Aa [Crocinitomicaceae bacterium]|nr:pesticidal protein Cry7Aa [Crocinitomicaceae bacterium]
MITVEKYGIIISPTDLEFENNATFNPGVIQDGNTVHILYRATQHGNFSTIGYAKTDGPLKVIERKTEPLVSREFEYETNGLEDPRIVKIDDLYYITFTAYDGNNALGALATSKDLVHFEKHGIITPKINYRDFEALLNQCNQTKLNPKYHHYYHLFVNLGISDDSERLLNDKDVVLFPRKINGKFAMLHRIWPGIQIVYFNDWSDLTPEFWKDYIRNLTDYIVLDPKEGYHLSYLGAGCPPIETEDGWLLIYHGVEETSVGRTYHAEAAMLQIDNPQIEISRLKEPLFSPTKDWEKDGEVNNVVFPTGFALFDKDLYIYYGAADRHIAVAKVNIDELKHELRTQL